VDLINVVRQPPPTACSRFKALVARKEAARVALQQARELVPQEELC
jgi:hypothetical protein